MTQNIEKTKMDFNLGRIIGQGRIKDDAWVFQDHDVFKWIDSYNGRNKDMVFDVEWDGLRWHCKADGYGYLRSRGEDGEYGNGKIMVMDFEGVELLRPSSSSSNNCGIRVVKQPDDFISGHVEYETETLCGESACSEQCWQSWVYCPYCGKKFIEQSVPKQETIQLGKT